MAKNELISLALISNGPLHAYSINNIIKGMELDKLAQISQASIYNSLTRLKKDGCVAETIAKVGNMPERKVYSITEKGKKQLYDELKAMIMTENIGESPLNLAIIFSYGLRASEIIQFIEQKIQNLKANIALFQQKYSACENCGFFNLMISVKALIKHLEVEMETAYEYKEFLEKNPDFYMDKGKELLQTLDQCVRDVDNNIEGEI